MGQALYRKYRSKNLSEIVGQDHITQTLQKALKQGRLSHAYLFTGPRGVGKTSIARILAYEINELEYGDTNGALDIIEIDAASNRRIDEIRELRDKVHVAPSSSKYKVYIIDEVHMLTREAFNALLKTLEEPPEHAVFILATTDAHKLPETIVSRTQRFTFKPVPKEQVVDHLQEIAKQEGIAVDKEALELLAEHGEGSFRDSISMLDQASSHADKVDADLARRLLGVPSDSAIEDVVAAVASGQSTEVMNVLLGLYDQGLQASAIAKRLSQNLRERILKGDALISTETTFTLLNQLLTVPVSHSPERLLEIILLEATPQNMIPAPQQRQVTPKPAPQVQTDEPPASKADDTIESPKGAETPDTTDDENQGTVAEEGQDADLSSSKINADEWDRIVQSIKKKHNTLYGVIRMAEPEFSENGLNLVFSFAFHQKRFNEPASQKAIATIAKEVMGSPVTIHCSLDTSKQPKVPAEELPEVSEPVAPPEQVTAISNIFGGGELLES